MADGVVPPRAAYAWNQALMDLGATLCRAQPAAVPGVPAGRRVRRPAAHARRSDAGQPQGEFRGSNRYYRGRIVDALRGLRGAVRRLPLTTLRRPRRRGALDALIDALAARPARDRRAEPVRLPD